MGSGKLTPTTKKNEEYGYELAHRLARKRLAEIDDIEQQCRKSGSQYRLTGPRKTIAITYLNQPYLITLPDVVVTSSSGEGEIPIRDKILILHYLTTAKGTPLSDKMITYKELPEGVNYYPTFYKRAIEPLVTNFGNEPQKLLNCAIMLGGYEANYGDVAVTIYAFSRVPITLVLWKGDDELTPEGNIIFNSNISDYLSTEDVNVLCETIAWKLVKILKAGGDNPDANRG